MSTHDFCRYQANFKTQGGSLINLYAESDFELRDQLKALTEALAPDIIAAERALTAVSNVVYTPAASQQPQPTRVSAATPPPQQGTYAEASPVAQQQQPQQHGPSCQHGPMTYREGTSKAGKPYRAYFCPSQDRNNQCDPQWIR